MKIDKNLKKLKDDYIFCKIRDKISNISAEDMIDLSVGDVSLPLGDSVIQAIISAAVDMSSEESFRGYSPVVGYDFLRKAISERYRLRNVDISESEIFISDGAKSNCANICDVFEADGVLLQSPTYPVYVDSNIIFGNKIEYMYFDLDGGLVPLPPYDRKCSRLIYLCSPNNPTGMVYTKEQLCKWVEYAIITGSIIIFDAAYEAYITGDEPHSIYEIDGADKCAVEICSFSKMAGFTGIRCGWTVIPESLIASGESVHDIWKKCISVKSNGISYISQCAALAALSKAGQEETCFRVKYYLENADILRKTLSRFDINIYGGISAPYIWCKCPNDMTSWELFDDLIQKEHIACAPGIGFGANGEGYFRLSCFGKRNDIILAGERLEHYFGGYNGI